MNRKFIREYDIAPQPEGKEKLRIGVIAMTPGAGATFVTSALAKALTAGTEEKANDSVAFVELKDGGIGKPLLYDSMAMDRRFARRKFNRFYTGIRRKDRVRSLYNMEDGISWALMTPDENSACISLTDKEDIKLVNNISADTALFDIGGRDKLDNVITEMDKLVFVIDPLPSRVISGIDMYRRIKSEEIRGKKVAYVLNKYNAGVNERRVGAYLKQRKFVKIPVLPPEHVYGSEYRCKLPPWDEKIWQIIREKVSEIIESLGITP